MAQEHHHFKRHAKTTENELTNDSKHLARQRGSERRTTQTERNQPPRSRGRFPRKTSLSPGLKPQICHLRLEDRNGETKTRPGNRLAWPNKKNKIKPAERKQQETCKHQRTTLPTAHVSGCPKHSAPGHRSSCTRGHTTNNAIILCCASDAVWITKDKIQVL